jgi:hypothetical protein
LKNVADCLINKIKLLCFDWTYRISGDIAWPAGFPDISVSDYFIWQHSKTEVCGNKCHVFRELREPMRDDIRTIDEQQF